MVSVEQLSATPPARRFGSVGELLQAASPPSDTIINYTRPGLDEDPAVLVVGAVHAESVDRSLVLGIRGRNRCDDVLSWSRKFGDRQSLGCCRVEKCAVTSDHDDVRIVDSLGSREVDRVIPAQSMNFSQLTSPTSERIIELDKIDFLEQGVEVSDGVAEMPRGDAAKSLGLSESSACLRVDEPHAHNPISAVPERRGTRGAGLGDQQWHNC